MDLTAIPHSPGVYLMRDRVGHIIYIGKAKDLAKRMSSYFMERADREPKVAAMVAMIRHFDYIPTASEREALVMEQQLIRKLRPHFNIMWRDDKSFPWIKLTINEDFPRLFLTRKRVNDGAKYFGPYPNVRQVSSLLRYLWRSRLFPLRPCRYDFSTENPLDPAKIKGCLYYHTKECPAPCANRIAKEDYQRFGQEAALFFEGRYTKLVELWQIEMREAAAKKQYERAAELRDHIVALERMGERVTFRQVELDDVNQRVGRSRSITDLQKALNLKRPPMRIECFDISHTQGVETVASMVVFERGEPKKSDYRKFIIRTVKGIDDFASMAEVVGRRYRRLKKESKRLPDLILIDGGKGQLSAAKAALIKEVGKAIPPIASLAKRDEELFLPGLEAPILLDKDTPALHLVQAVRDEAHRFAVTFHRLRRGKRMLLSDSGIDLPK
jgi:excinuclease ABC subunit C